MTALNDLYAFGLVNLVMAKNRWLEVWVPEACEVEGAEATAGQPSTHTRHTHPPPCHLTSLPSPSWALLPALQPWAWPRPGWCREHPGRSAVSTPACHEAPISVPQAVAAIISDRRSMVTMPGRKGEVGGLCRQRNRPPCPWRPTAPSCYP